MPVEKPCHVNQIRSMLSCLRWPRRRTIIGFAFLGLVCIGTLVYFMNRVEYRLLYRDLNPADMQVITAEFREQKKNFIVQGSSILVEASRTEIHALRGKSLSGLPMEEKLPMGNAAYRAGSRSQPRANLLAASRSMLKNQTGVPFSFPLTMPPSPALALAWEGAKQLPTMMATLQSAS